MVLIARALIINIQKDENFEVIEYSLLLNFITSYGRREKNQFLSIGALGSEKTSLFYERGHWQQLLLFLNEQENLKFPDLK